MSELANLQNQFQQFLLTGQPEITDSVIQTQSVSVNTRLGIYRDAYSLRLIENLSINFPALYAYLGTEEFNKLANYYIEAHPSSFRSIRWYGDRFADFIKINYKDYSYLAELADFEWKMTLTFDAADADRVHIENMANVPPESWANLQFILHPSLLQIKYFWNVIPLWQALTQDKQLPEIQKKTESLTWVMWRHEEYMIQFYSLSQVESWALENLSKGISFGELCEGLCQWIKPEEVGLSAASYLKGWIQKGMISQLTLVV